MVLFLPFGATSGFVSVTIGFIAKQHGLGDATIGGLVAINLLPHTFKFFWAPLPDTLLTRRHWYLGANIVSSITLIAIGLVPVDQGTVSLLRTLIFTNALAITFLGMATEGLMANVVSAEERGTAAGWLQAGNLGGAGVGGGLALYLAQRKTILGRGRVIVLMAGTFGTGLVAFSFSRVAWLSASCLVVVGFGMMVQMASSNTIIQTIVDEDKRGRVMSFYMMAFLGTVPFGSLIAGWLSSRIGAPNTLLLGGVCCLSGAAWFAWELPIISVAVRPIYVRMGILPQVAAGISNAAELSVPPERQ
jgi:MFS family permease